jgi:hypothetical protein
LQLTHSSFSLQPSGSDQFVSGYFLRGPPKQAPIAVHSIGVADR